MIVQIVLQPIIMMSLSMLWGLIHGIQVVAYLMLFNIPIPGNVLDITTVLYELATFDLIPEEWLPLGDIIDGLVGKWDNNKDVYLSAQAKESGYDRTNPIANLIWPIFMVACASVVVIFLKGLSMCSTRLKIGYDTVKDKLRWNACMRLFNEEYLTLSLACMIKVAALDFSNWYEAFSSVFAILLLLVAIVSPFVVTKWLWKMHAKGHHRLLE